MTKSNFKKPKPIKNKNFLNEIRQRNCIICQTFHEPQISPTTAHHVFHDRFSGGKTSDLDAIPLSSLDKSTPLNHLPSCMCKESSPVCRSP